VQNFLWSKVDSKSLVWEV